MIYAIEFVGVKKGLLNPVQLREEIKKEVEARIRFMELVKSSESFFAFKLCLNDADHHAWAKPILYFDSMKKSIPTIIQQRKPRNQEATTLSIHFVRVCGEVVERCKITLDSELLVTDLHLALEKESEANSHVDAYAVVVVQNYNRLRLHHVHFKGLKKFRKLLPDGKLGGYSWDELERAKKWLFR